MVAKQSSKFGPKVRLLLEQALLEALKRHIDGGSRKPRQSAASRKKKVSKKKVSRRPAKKRGRKAAARRTARR